MKYAAVRQDMHPFAGEPNGRSSPIAPEPVGYISRDGPDPEDIEDQLKDHLSPKHLRILKVAAALMLCAVFLVLTASASLANHRSRDTTPPDTTITQWENDPSGDYNDYLLSAKATESATFQFRLDGDPADPSGWMDLTGSPPWKIRNVGDGSHTIYVRSTDSAGNTDPTPASRQFTVKPPSSGYSPLPTCPAPTLATQIGNASAGSTLTLPNDCAYRETVTVNKALTIVGGHMRGSDVWTDWTQSGDNWISSRSIPAPGQATSSGGCQSGTSQCQWEEQVFSEGGYVQQLADGSNPGANQFALVSSGDRRVVLGFDPTGKDIEVSTRSKWLIFGATGITVDGIEARHAQNGAGYHTAMFSERGNNTIKNAKISWTHGDAVGMHRATGQLVQNSHIHHTGKNAVAAYQGSVSLIGNTLHHTGTEKFNGWDSAAVKLTYQVGGTWSGNKVYNNPGHALWCDLNCDGVIIENNRIWNNGGSGIFYEVSLNGIIRGNKMWENGHATPASMWDGAFRVTSSDKVEVYNNYVAWNRTGLGLIKTDVSAWPERPQDMTDIYVHDNYIFMSREPGKTTYFTTCDRSLALAWCNSMSGFNFFDPAKNNRALNNRYYYTFAEESNWPRWYLPNQGYWHIGDWNNAVTKSGDAYLTGAQKDEILTAHGMPLNP